MTYQTYKIIVFSMWIILPILPAFILYKFLPKNQVAVKGPFKGLTVDMAGAFAGYFLLFIASYFIVKSMIFEILNKSEVWKVKVNVLDDRGRPLDEKRNRPDITFYPQASINNGVFQFDIPVIIENDSYDFPGISFSAYSDDASKLFISSDLNNDLYDPDVVRPGGKTKQQKGNWDYDYNRRILTYTMPIRMIKEAATTKAPMSIVEIDSSPAPSQIFLNGRD